MFHNLPIKIVSVVLAIIFWLFVVSLENVYVRLPAQIPVTAFNKGEEVALTTPLPSISLGIRTDDPLLERSLTETDFEAYIDLSNVGVGEHTLPISVTARNSHVSVVRIEPAEVTITLEPIKQKFITLTAKTTGAPARGYMIKGVDIEPQSITVSGGDSILRRITRGEVMVAVAADVENTFSLLDAPVNFYDESGAKVEGVSLDNTKISATVRIEKTISTKEVGVHPVLKGSLVNATVKSVSVDPVLMSVEGDEEILKALETVDTAAIDLSTIRTDGDFKSVVRKVALQLPAGVTLSSRTNFMVSVTITFQPTTP